MPEVDADDDDNGPSLELREPYRSQFETMIRAGAADQDIHDSGLYRAAGSGQVDQAFVDRELERVDWHLRSLVPLLEGQVGQVNRILDFGCGTGGTTLALALAPRLAATEVIGIDANPSAIRAASLRGRGHGFSLDQLRFQHLPAGDPLPYEDGAFDLVVTVSVLEFITSAESRGRAVDELRRVVRPGGFLYIATPRPGVREYHTRRWLGDAVKAAGEPWSSPPWDVARWGRGWERISVGAQLASRVSARLPWLPEALVARSLGWALPYLSRWNKLLLRRPD